MSDAVTPLQVVTQMEEIFKKYGWMQGDYGNDEMG